MQGMCREANKSRKPVKARLFRGHPPVSPVGDSGGRVENVSSLGHSIPHSSLAGERRPKPLGDHCDGGRNRGVEARERGVRNELACAERTNVKSLY